MRISGRCGDALSYINKVVADPYDSGVQSECLATATSINWIKVRRRPQLMWKESRWSCIR